MAVAIVLAGGKGSRMNSDVAKQYLNICGKEVLYYSLRTFSDSDIIDRIVLVTRREDIEYCKSSIVDRYGFDKVSDIVAGGRERYDSVYAGLCVLEDCYDGIVMIHDGARPFVTEKMIIDAVETAAETGACTVGVPVKDTIKIVDDKGFGVGTPDRSRLYQIQTPQTFRCNLIKEAYRRLYQDKNPKITDDTMLIEQYMDVRSKVILGSYENIKITTPEDMEIAEKFVKKFEKTC